MTIKITSATFSACVVGKDGLPDDQLPVIALVGRSNVGKSSLINCITGRKELARTSSTPGKTLTINYYCINEEFYIVDLPGYGYAKVSKITRQRIQTMMNEFFAESKSLKAVVQILDIRHKPSPLDTQMLSWIKEQKINSIAILTKADKLSHQQVIKMRAAISKDLKMGYVMAFSAKSAAGKEEFLDAVEKIIAGLEVKGSEIRSRKSQSQPRGTAEKPRRTQRPQGPKPAGSEANVKAPAEKKSLDSSPDKNKTADKPSQPSQPQESQEPRSGQNRRRRWKNKKSAGNDDKKKQPEI